MGIPLPPPWVLMSLVLGFAGHLQDFKELAGLGVSIVTGRGEDAGCKICDKLVTMMLKEIELDDMQEGGGIDCHGMCFGLGKCVCAACPVPARACERECVHVHTLIDGS